MKDPVRLLDDPEAPETARALLRAARAPEPTAAERAALWGSIEAAIGGPVGPDGGGGPDPSAGGSATGGGAPLATSAAASGAVKVSASALAGSSPVLGSTATTWIGLLAAAGVSVGTALVVGAPDRPAEAPPAVVTAEGGMRPPDARAPRRTPEAADGEARAVASATARPARGSHDTSASAPPSDEARAVAGAPLSPPRVARSVSGAAPIASSAAPPSTADAPALPASTAAAEAAATAEARDLLAAGQASRALDVLEAARVRFSGGVLVQERAALTVEALGRSGQADRAASLAHAFLDAWPGSTHAGRVTPWAR